jgi:Fe-S-cluster containining protein
MRRLSSYKAEAIAGEATMPEAGGTCTHCGACCITYRVAFRRRELDGEPGGCVPTLLCEAIDNEHYCMRGTRHPPRRCAALRGTVGMHVHCAIYEHRPSPCRAFAPDAGSGDGDAYCGDARRLHGLPPLAGSYDAFPIA